jgi:hypothetical protein
MPLTTEGSPLVSGGSGPKAQATQKVRVLRAFYVKNDLQKVGAQPTLPRSLALELRGLNKVEFVNDSKKE